MSLFDYSYSLATYFPAGIDTSELQYLVQAENKNAGIIQAPLDHIDTSATDATLYFTSELSQKEQEELTTNVFAAHNANYATIVTESPHVRFAAFMAPTTASSSSWTPMSSYLFRGTSIDMIAMTYFAISGYATGDATTFTVRVVNASEGDAVLAEVEFTNTVQGAVLVSPIGGTFAATPRYKALLRVDVRKDDGTTGSTAVVDNVVVYGQ